MDCSGPWEEGCVCVWGGGGGGIVLLESNSSGAWCTWVHVLTLSACAAPTHRMGEGGAVRPAGSNHVLMPLAPSFTPHLHITTDM